VLTAVSFGQCFADSREGRRDVHERSIEWHMLPDSQNVPASLDELMSDKHIPGGIA
jgi:hypothetical protein